MADDWINSVDVTIAKKQLWNSLFLRKSFALTDTTKTSSLLYFLLNRPFDNAEFLSLRDMFLSTNLTDAQLLVRLKNIRANLVDVRLVGGITLPTDLVLVNHNFSFDVRANLRVDLKPT